MNLQRIKIIAENQHKKFKALASAIGMSEGNLHRCVRENTIQAEFLEKIASELNVSIVEFFDEEQSTVSTKGDYSPASFQGNYQVAGDPVLLERVKQLEERIKEKDERIADLKERIDELKQK